MHRTQIYFEESLFSDIKQQAQRSNLSISAYIREVLKKELDNQRLKKESSNFSAFAGMWQDYDINQEALRKKAWK
ncbi:MAG: hypothetical protein ACWA5U_03950 [bacterium]